MHVCVRVPSRVAVPVREVVEDDVGDMDADGKESGLGDKDCEGVASSLLVDDADAPSDSDCDGEDVNEVVCVADPGCEPLSDEVEL